MIYQAGMIRTFPKPSSTIEDALRKEIEFCEAQPKKYPDFVAGLRQALLIAERIRERAPHA